MTKSIARIRKFLDILEKHSIKYVTADNEVLIVQLNVGSAVSSEDAEALNDISAFNEAHPHSWELFL